MKCVNHVDNDAVGFCRNCGKALCLSCRHDVRGVIYCEDCLAGSVAGAPPVGPAAGPNPGVALALGFIPGVGAIYNGEYAKAFLHVLIFGGLISVMSSGAARGMEPLLGLLLGAFYFYMPIEAYRTAKRRSTGGAPAEEWSTLFADIRVEAPVGAIVLIGLGVLFLLNSFGILQIGNIFKFWPVILIILGILMLRKRLGGPPAPPSGESSPRPEA